VFHTARILVSDASSNSDPEILAYEIPWEEASLSAVSAGGDAAATSASEMLLTSRDFLVSGPTTSRGGPPRSTRPSQVGQVGDATRTPVVDPLIGLVVADRYRILEAIGRGGMGIVYKVEHVRIGKLLAMKVLRGELSRNAELGRRFKREALMVSRLQSTNTVQVFDFGVSEGLTYLVMELVNGESLSHALQAAGPMAADRLGKIVIQVCTSLAEAHRKGIVHRDIKPDNIMLLAADGGADVAKVLDFGLAKLRETEGINDVTQHGMILGTPYYMAPEQIRGEPVDARTDVYSIGALMYRALTGYHPFSGAPMTVLARHLNEVPIAPIERAPQLGIPPGMSRLVMRALSKKPGERFQRVEDLQRQLIEESRAAGSSSVEDLLDSVHLRRLSRSAELASSAAMPAVALATRDEVDSYERELRRARYGVASMAAILVSAAALSTGLVMRHDTQSRGTELEPNDTAAEATTLTLGRAMQGQLGKRIDATHGDRDFYAFDLPARSPGEQSLLRLRVSALPSMATCALLYQPGFAGALGQYCVGRPGRELDLRALQLPPGHYLLAVMQDLDPYGGVQPQIQESISDSYTVVAESAIAEAGSETEPNDHVASATPLAIDRPCSARIGWTHDEDVFCVAAEVAAPIRWTVRPAGREGGVLEATRLRGDEEAGAPVRIHLDEGGKRSAADVVGPWQSAPVVRSATAPRCLRVRLTTDPWSTERTAGVLGAQSEPYVVEATTTL
jgi:serine/threonine-protein kinase